jgi:hypothetical protein
VLCATLVKNFTSPAQEDAKSEERVCYFHYPSEIHLDIDVVSEVFEGIDVGEMLPPHLWVGRAKTAGIDWHFSGQDFEATVAEGLALKR